MISRISGGKESRDIRDGGNALKFANVKVSGDVGSLMSCDEKGNPAKDGPWSSGLAYQ